MKLFHTLYYRIIFASPKYTFLKSRTNLKLLDLGCGEGNLLRRFIAFNPNLKITAIDYLDFKAKLSPGIEFFELDITRDRLPFEDNYFDIITIINVIEHLNNPEFTLREAFRVLKPKGRILIEAPSIRSLFVPSQDIKDFGFSGPLNFYDDPTHIRPHSRCSLGILLRKVGFSVMKTGYSRNIYLFLASPFLILLSLIIRKRLWLTKGIHNLIGWIVFAVGEKPKI